MIKLVSQKGDTLPKTIVKFLLGSGVVLLVIGISGGGIGVAVVGAALTVVGVLSALGAIGTLTEGEVVESWSTLIENGQGSAEGILGDTETLIEASRVPEVSMDRQQIAPSVASGLAGRTRDFLVITQQGNSRLAPYKFFLNCRDFGNNLDVNWYVTYKPSAWHTFLTFFPFMREVQQAWSDLDLFDQADLRAYVTNAHRCMLKTVDSLMLKLAQDPTTVDRKSRGFLGIS